MAENESVPLWVAKTSMAQDSQDLFFLPCHFRPTVHIKDLITQHDSASFIFNVMLTTRAPTRKLLAHSPKLRNQTKY